MKLSQAGTLDGKAPFELQTGLFEYARHTQKNPEKIVFLRTL